MAQPATTVSGGTIWVYGHSGEDAVQETAARLGEVIRELGQPVEEIDAAGLARRAYKEGAGSITLPLAIGFTSQRLNRHGVHVIVRSARGPSSGFHWSGYKPERLLDVVLDGNPVEGDTPTPTIRLDSVREENDQGVEEVRVDVAKVVEGLKAAGWFGGEVTNPLPKVDDEDIRRRLENLGYL